jgi:hypothetical protein
MKIPDSIHRVGVKPVLGLRLLLITSCIFLFSTGEVRNGSVLLASDFKAENVYSQSPRFLASLQRVALLPVAASSQAGDLPEGCETMMPVLLDELVRTRKFEVVAIKPEDLSFSTGHREWTGAETMPVDFFTTLQRISGCDAVLFCELTEYKAYAPLAIGWRLKLVDVRTKAILWAADEVFDARTTALAQKNSILGKITATLTHPDEQAWVEATSPRVFGHNTISAMLKTLPER